MNFCHLGYLVGFLFSFQLVSATSPISSTSTSLFKHAAFRKPASSIKRSRANRFLNSIRGGDADDDDDEERYSRQFYTLGARAHSLVRTATILIDGPVRSGLVYESVKNLALSGVGKIIILTNDEETALGKLEDNYFNHEMDDLGVIYRRGAKAECYPTEEDLDDVELMVEYIRRLNPSVKVETMKRDEFLSGLTEDDNDAEIVEILGRNPVLMCIDRPLTTQKILNKACRNLSGSMSQVRECMPFISIETAGVYGKAFCDFGDEFYVVDEDGETPKATLLEKVEMPTGNDDAEIIVNCVEGERHDVSKGDRISFQFRNSESCEALDDKECVISYVKNPTCFTAEIHSKAKGSEGVKGQDLKTLTKIINDDANGFARVKTPRALSFLPLKEALKVQRDPTKEIFAASDLDKSFDTTRREAIMSSFATLELVVKKKSKIPSMEESDYFVDKVCQHNKENGKDFASIASSFAKSAKAKFTPLQAIYGALGAQEALKAASGLYNPIKQFLLYDCDELLSGIKRREEEETSKMSGLKYILGKRLTKKLASQKVFVVGSGAIGCEILKNLAAMNVGTKKKKGSIILTDMDTIEKSNLSRQLLFRDADVGKCKSAAAEEAMQRLNSRVQMDTHTSKVGDDVKGTYFDENFWSDGVDVVLNALDNVEARLFIDSQCVANRKALVDAGTLGAKGNVQVVVPGQSESYASSSDPPEPTIPVCTLKNFPYEISHTIQWGRDLFDGLFNRRPSQVNEQKESLLNMAPSQFAKSLFDKLGEDAAMDTANELAEDCCSFDPLDDDYDLKVKSASLEWAAGLARTLFYDSMTALLKQHPLDSLDEDDKPFWSGTRKAPTPLSYCDHGSGPQEQELINESIVEFVRCTARLRIEAYNSNQVHNKEDGLPYSSVTSAEVKAVLRKHLQRERVEADKEVPFQKRIMDKVKEAKVASKEITQDLNIVSFEKDDDTNGHVAFVTAASNLRAISYGITPVDAMETRRVAGRIVPAMITTTAFVSALSCVELVKLTTRTKFELHRNAFINLALPFFAFTTPLPAEKVPGLFGTSHTLWDKIVVKESQNKHLKGGISLRQFIRKIKAMSYGKEKKVEVSNISIGPYMLYANFLHDEDVDMLNAPVMQLVVDAITSGDIDDEDFSDDDSMDSDEANNDVSSEEIETLKRRSFTDFTVLVEDAETGEEAELPPVRLIWWKEK